MFGNHEHIQRQGYEASKVDSLKPLKYCSLHRGGGGATELGPMSSVLA